MKVWNLGVPPGRPKNQVHGYEHTHLYSSNKRRRRRKNISPKIDDIPKSLVKLRTIDCSISNIQLG